MTRSRLTHLLSAIVAAAACAGVPSCTPCPYTEVLRSFTVEIDGMTACDLADTAFRGRELAPSIDATACAANCKDAEVNSCFLDQAYLNAFFAVGTSNSSSSSSSSGMGGGGGSGPSAACPTMPTKATLTCQVTETRGSYHDGCPIAGRRPANLETTDAGDGTVGAYLARCAHLEAASVIAFQTLAAELAELDAPAELLADVREAEADEVRHAEMMTRLAGAHGAAPPSPVVALRAARPIVEIAVENAVEGMVREAFGAAVALHQARSAADPRVRAALGAIADDECAHAALSFRVAAFLAGRLDARERARVEKAKRAAIVALKAEIEEPAPAHAEILGLPEASLAQRMLAKMERELWASAHALAAPRGG